MQDMREWGLARFKTDTWGLGLVRRGSEKGTCCLYGEDGDAMHILLKWSESRK